jgi:hypothetical protein
MATTTFNAAEIEVRRKLLHEELATLEAEKIKNLGAMHVVDYHHPERSPGWPIYNLNDPRNKFPQLLYHPTAKNQRIEDQRLGLQRRNEANPMLAPMDIPPSECLMLKVANATERATALANGFVETPPQPQRLDMNSPAELIGQAAVNPLASINTPLVLSVETIIKLNMMSKDELVKHAVETYGVNVSEEDSKVSIIEAIQKGAGHD